MDIPPIVNGAKAVLSSDIAIKVLKDLIARLEFLQRMVALFTELLYEVERKFDAYRLANNGI